MTKHEFENLTGIFVPNMMYNIIENEYMNSDADKETFCNMYKNNTDGLAEKVQRYTDKIYLDEAELKTQLNKALKQLEAEYEWKPYDDSNQISQSDYVKYVMDSGVYKITQHEAKTFIRNTFGFEYDSIDIINYIPQKEINRHGIIRCNADFPQICRKPLYCSTDYNYIMFTCKGYTYECIDGELRF